MRSVPLLVLATFILVPAPGHAGEADAKPTIAYLKTLQTRSGGFLAQVATDPTRLTPTLRSTSAAIRALHYFGADLPNGTNCARFVDSCFFAEAGAFGDTPTAKPDVFSTAVGMMAVAELKLPAKRYAAGTVKYLSDHVKSFEDIRIAAAGLESLKEKSPKADDWIKEVRMLQNPDGTFGKGPGQARATGGSVVALLRLGTQPVDTALVLKVLKMGQRADGGYGKDDAKASDLETTYRVLRCFVMMKSRPDNVDGIRSFITKCRNADGGYGVAPGAPSSVGGTYYAAIMLHWLKS